MSWARSGLANRLVRLFATRRSVEEGQGDVIMMRAGDEEDNDNDEDDASIDSDDQQDDDNYSDATTSDEGASNVPTDQPEGRDQMDPRSSLKHELEMITSASPRSNPPSCIRRKVLHQHPLMCRELGLPSSKYPASHLIPRKREQVAMFRAKVFCGSYDARTGDQFISAAQDCMIRMYDTSCGRFKLVKTILAQEVGWSILDTVMSPCQGQLLYTSWSPVIRLVNYDASDLAGSACHQEALCLESRTNNLGIFSVRYSTSGREVIAGTSDHHVYICDLDQRKQVLRMRAHENDVNAVTFADESSNILISAGDEGLIKVWDRRQLASERRGKPVGVFAGHYDGITFLDARGDGRHVISNSKDQTIKLWDMRCFASRSGVTESQALTLSGAWDYRWAPVPRRVSMNRERMLGDSSIMTYRGHTVRQTLIRCHFSPPHSTGQRYIYTGCASGNVFIYDALTGEVVSELSSHMQNCRDVSWHPFFPELISSSWDGSTVRWTYADDEILSDQDHSFKRSRRFSARTAYMASRRHAHQHQEFDDL